METFKFVMELLLNPFFLTTLFLFCLLIVGKHIKLRNLLMCLTAILLVLVLLSTGWLPRYLTQRLESQYQVVNVVNPSIQWVVVISGGKKQQEGMPANELLYAAGLKRLLEGVRLFRQLPHAKLVLSGGASEGKPEAVLMAEICNSFSISNEYLVLEQDSLDTKDQAMYLKAIVGNKPFYLVTSATHMPRAMALFKTYGLNPIAAPTDFTLYWTTDTWEKMFIPNAYNLSYFSIAYHELLGRLWALGWK